MAHLYRLVVGFIAWLCLASVAIASITCGKEFQNFDGTWSSSAMAAAGTWMGKKGAYATCTGYSMYPFSVLSANDTTGAYTFNWAYCNGTNNGFGGPANGSLTMRDKLCECAGGTHQVGNTCVDNCAEFASKDRGNFDVYIGPYGDWSALGYSLADRKVCYPEDYQGTTIYCQVNVQLSMGYPGQTTPFSTTKDAWRAVGHGTGTGISCDPALDGNGLPPNPAAPPSKYSDNDPCTAQQYKGTVNGVTVCIDPVGGSTVSSTPKTSTATATTTNPDGTTVTSSVNNKGTTTCAGDICVTVTSSTTTVNGSTTGSTGTTTQSRGDYCKDHPMDKAACGGDSSFSGNCNANFTCSGDAVLCATAAAVNQTQCALQTASDESALYTASKGGGSGLGTTTVSIGSGSFNQTDLLPGGVGLVDKPITISGHGYSWSGNLPLSSINPYLAALGNILVACALIAAILIVGRG
jgi:hypothetical protein